jgi:hypothetical protein
MAPAICAHQSGFPQKIFHSAIPERWGFVGYEHIDTRITLSRQLDMECDIIAKYSSEMRYRDAQD